MIPQTVGITDKRDWKLYTWSKKQQKDILWMNEWMNFMTVVFSSCDVIILTRSFYHVIFLITVILH